MLTLMGDESTVPWRVLSVDFLVQDMETGGEFSAVRPFIFLLFVSTMVCHQLKAFLMVWCVAL